MRINTHIFHRFQTLLGLISGLLVWEIYTSFKINLSLSDTNIIIFIFIGYVLLCSVAGIPVLLIMGYQNMKNRKKPLNIEDIYRPTLIDSFKVLLGFFTGLLIWAEYVMLTATLPFTGLLWGVLTGLALVGGIYLLSIFPFILGIDLKEGWID